jgi:hypothetical protein
MYRTSLRHSLLLSLLTLVSTYSTQAFLSEVYFAGKPGDPISSDITAFLNVTGLEMGLELKVFQPQGSSLSLPEGGILIALEDGILKDLSLTQREELENWLIGDYAHSGGTLLVLSTPQNSLIEEQRPDPLVWNWLEALIHPAAAQLRQIHENQFRTDLPVLTLSATNHPGTQPIRASFIRELPHPNPGMGIAGGRVFFTSLTAQPYIFEQDESGDYAASIILEHLREALMWSVGLSDGSSLEIPVLELQAKSQNQEVRLDWLTANELDKANYEVQRTENGLHWELIESLPAMGRRTKVNYYSYLDTDLGPGFYFYRIRQTDDRGTEYFSGLAAVSIVVADPVVDLYPNPARDRMTLQVSSTRTTRMRYTIETVNGTIVQQQDWQGGGQFFATEISVEQLPPGLYQLRVQTEQAERIEQLVKY